jgi:phage shock protein E
MNVWLKRSLLIVGGGTAGFAYYYYVGCVSGTCPITSNPYISTAYGMMMGAVLGWGGQKKPGSSMQ